MTHFEHKEALQILKDGLIENLAIYHERITLLIQITQFDILEDCVEFEAKVIKPLDKSDAEENRLYQYIVAMGSMRFSASYPSGNENKPLVVNKKIGGSYCPFILWLDPELAMFVKDNDDEITRQIPELILWGEDWKRLLT